MLFFSLGFLFGNYLSGLFVGYIMLDSFKGRGNQCLSSCLRLCTVNYWALVVSYNFPITALRPLLFSENWFKSSLLHCVECTESLFLYDLSCTEKKNTSFLTFISARFIC